MLNYIYIYLDNYNLIKSLSANSISSSIVNLNKDINASTIVENLIKNRDHSSIGIFIEYGCPESSTIIQQVTKISKLNYENNCFNVKNEIFLVFCCKVFFSKF